MNIFSIDHIIIFILIIIAVLLYYNLKSIYPEHLTNIATSSNEGVQNIASMFNNDTATLTNLTLTGNLKIGNLIIDKDGNITTTGNINSKNSTVSGNLNASSGNIGRLYAYTPNNGENRLVVDEDAKLYLYKLNSHTFPWTISGDGNFNFNDGNVNNINMKNANSTNLNSSQSISVNGYTLSNYDKCANGRSFGITDNARNRVYSFFDNHLRTVQPGSCSDIGRMDL